MQNNNKITTLIFDLGGVLVNLDWNRCVSNFKKIGIEEMAGLLSVTLQTGFVLDYEKGLITDAEFRDKLREYSSQTLTDEQIDEAWTSFLVDIPSEKLELLMKLKKKYRILMLSNTNNLSFSYCANHMFNVNGYTLSDYFDTCYLSNHMHLCKPDAPIFEELLRDSALKAEECLFLDDGIHNIKAAEQLGFGVEFIKPYSKVAEWDFLKQLEY